MVLTYLVLTPNGKSSSAHNLLAECYHDEHITLDYELLAPSFSLAGLQQCSWSSVIAPGSIVSTPQP